MIFSQLAVLFTALFVGAAIYITVVEHPARLKCPISTALEQWRESYKRAAIIQAFLAILGSVFGVIAWHYSQNDYWLIAVVLLAAVIPFTFIVIFPTNKQLHSKLNNSEGMMHKLLVRWGYLHAVRSGLSLVALLIMLFICGVVNLSPSSLV